MPLMRGPEDALFLKVCEADYWPAGGGTKKPVSRDSQVFLCLVRYFCAPALVSLMMLFKVSRLIRYAWRSDT